MPRRRITGSSGYLVGHARKGGTVTMSKKRFKTASSAKKAARGLSKKHPKSRVLVLKSTVVARHGW